jgi:uncharacterized protein YndB with AHSA1/START domain
METTKLSANAITIETTVNAPMEKVWESWTSPDAIQNWCNASPEWHTPKATNDVRVGGKFMTRMEAKDGSMGFDFEGIYTEVTPNRSIAYGMADGRQVHTTFEDHGNSVKIVESFDPENENPIEMQRGGWQAILDNFKKYTEEN